MRPSRRRGTEGLASDDAHEAVRIRLHRCFSWLARVERIEAEGLGADDAVLIYRWIAFNALYGRWDDRNREPAGDAESYQRFTRVLHEHDADGRLGALVREHRKLFEAIVGDEHLARHYWKDPDDSAHTRRAERAVRELREAIREGRQRAAMDSVLARVYLARCQLVHGAATFEGKLNRTAMRRCAQCMGLLLPTMCEVIIDHAWQTDWGGLCYPPRA